ncbi:MAG TPA: DUF4058 family protein [Gemmataceae bacterium]|nr:DUF4058 family protein [Gemmataceae bacterium]
MPSPFPGMDPYLETEKIWPVFQHHLVACLYQTLLPGLVDRYRARVSQRKYTAEQALFTSIIREDHEEEFIEIRQRSDSRLITLVDIVSPTNKTTLSGRQAYLDKRREAKTTNANLVEIDLVMQGQAMLDYSRDGLPDWDHAVTVTRATQPERYEIYTATLRKKLPKFRLPLAGDDRDTVVDLQSTFNRCFDQGNFAAQIDYLRDPQTKITDEDRRWINDMLRQQKVRK